jgi:predicted amidophosphoribosyltransferase
MPTPFMCHGCDKPTMNKNGVCDDCVKKENEKKRSRR